MPKNFRKVIGYGIITLGLVSVGYGFSEYMYALKSVQMILGKIIEIKPALYGDPMYQSIINIAIGQATAMKVLTYIVPGFIISSVGFISLFLDEVIQRLDSYADTGAKILDEAAKIFKADDEKIVDLTEDMEIKE
jgi:hypothetical protein